MHNIGKNIFINIAIGSGFKVNEIRIDQDESEFIDRIKDMQPDIIGMSCVLSTMMHSIKGPFNSLKKKGLGIV